MHRDPGAFVLLLPLLLRGVDSLLLTTVLPSVEHILTDTAGPSATVPQVSRNLVRPFSQLLFFSFQQTHFRCLIV